MPGRPRLTVVTPTLNQGAFIERTIRSVLDEGIEDLEFIVVDGGSTDGTQEIIRRYEDRIAWWVSEPDAGQTDAINKGLARATGEIVAYLNSDDLYLPGALTAVLDAFASSDASWVTGACRFVDASDVVYDVWRPEPPSGRRHAWITNPWAAPQPASFWRRELFERLGTFREDMHYVFDVEFMLRLVYAGEMPAILDRELAVRVVHDEAKSADQTGFDRERRMLAATFRPALTPLERTQLRLGQAALRLGLYARPSGRRPSLPAA